MLLYHKFLPFVKSFYHFSIHVISCDIAFYKNKREKLFGFSLLLQCAVNYLYLRFLAASDFFLRFTLGFS